MTSEYSQVELIIINNKDHLYWVVFILPNFTKSINEDILEMEEMNMTEDEIWCPIKGFEGLYEVSNLGRVKSIGYGKERILKLSIDKDGYLIVGLCKNGEQKKCKVHRIVAQTFIPNPQNLPQVNHIDENQSNNKVENLEWCDAKYNNNYGTHNQRISKPVLQFTKDGEFVKEWKSATDVEMNLNYSQGNISSCCTGRYKSAYNFIWKFKI